jgi:hypothetical protein
VQSNVFVGGRGKTRDIACELVTSPPYDLQDLVFSHNLCHALGTGQNEHTSHALLATISPGINDALKLQDNLVGLHDSGASAKRTMVELQVSGLPGAVQQEKWVFLAFPPSAPPSLWLIDQNNKTYEVGNQFSEAMLQDQGGLFLPASSTISLTQGVLGLMPPGLVGWQPNPQEDCELLGAKDAPITSGIVVTPEKDFYGKVRASGSRGPFGCPKLEQ